MRARSVRKGATYPSEADLVGSDDPNSAIVGWTVADRVHSIEISGTLTGSASDLTAGAWRTYSLRDVFGDDFDQAIRAFVAQVDIVDVPASFSNASGAFFVGICEGPAPAENDHELIGVYYASSAAIPRAAVHDGINTIVVASGGTATASDGPVGGTFGFTPATTGNGGSSQGYVQAAGIVDADGNSRNGGSARDILSHVYADPYLVIGVMSGDNEAIDCTIQFIPSYMALQGDWSGW